MRTRLLLHLFFTECDLSAHLPLVPLQDQLPLPTPPIFTRPLEPVGFLLVSHKNGGVVETFLMSGLSEVTSVT